jgi:hypothetical protein
MTPRRCMIVAIVAIAGCNQDGTRASSAAAVVRTHAGDLTCGGSVAIEPVGIDNCAWCSFDDYPTGRALLPPDHPPVFGPLDLHALIGADCAPLDPSNGPLVTALHAAIDDAVAIARQRVQGCYTCPGTWDLALDACGLPGPETLSSQAGTGCGVVVTAHVVASCSCEADPHAPAEICGDGRDNDGDGLRECEDPGCIELDGSCAAHEADCADGEDNDRDGAVDCADPDCAQADGCRYEPVEICGDAVDNDGDGLIDCADPDCAAACVPEEQCANGIDDDGDGLIDCADRRCAGEGACASDVERCHDGVDNDGDGMIDCADPDCADSPLCVAIGPTETCAPGIDGDGDGLAGCADPDCRSHPSCWVACGDDASCWF